MWVAGGIAGFDHEDFALGIADGAAFDNGFDGVFDALGLRQFVFAELHAEGFEFVG